MFSQLWHTGRSSRVEMAGGHMPVSASVDPSYWADASHVVSAPSGWIKPSPHRALDIAEIPGIVEDYRKAAERAKAAGFDGVELHAANGYLPDQFLQDGSNKRTDAYGGSTENRSRFLLELVEAMASVWGGDRVAVRIGPSGTWNGMSDSNPQALFSHVTEQLNRFGLAYLHIIEPRVKGNVLIGEGEAPVASEQLRQIFKGKIIAAGGFEPDSAEAIVAKGDADLVYVRPLFRLEPRPARAHQTGIAAQRLRPRHVLHLRCSRLYRLPVLRPVRRRIIPAESYALCVTLAPGSPTENSHGGWKVSAIATAPRPMPNEPM
jgi:N-ethylmaleimide reductase